MRTWLYNRRQSRKKKGLILKRIEFWRIKYKRIKKKQLKKNMGHPKDSDNLIEKKTEENNKVFF